MENKTIKNRLIENFDAIRKKNSRIIFVILLIIATFVYLNTSNNSK